MKYDFIAIPDEEVPQAANRLFQHLVTSYASETNKTVSMWKAVPENCLDFRPHEKTNTTRTIMVHQILSERRFFANLSALRNRPLKDCCLLATNRPCKPTSTSTFGWQNSDCHSWPQRPKSGG